MEERVTKAYVSRIPLSASGHDKNGVYHQTGLPLWAVDPNFGYSRLIRATTVAAAIEKARRIFPGAEIKWRPING